LKLFDIALIFVVFFYSFATPLLEKYFLTPSLALGFTSFNSWPRRRS